MPNIDNLNIRINASATSANRAINNLITSLSRLKSAVTPVAGATAVAQNLNEIANAVNKFSGVKLSSTVAKNLDSLKTALNGFSVQVGVASGLTAIARALGSFTGVRMSATIGRELNSLKTALAGFSVPAGAAGELTTLAGALTAFSGLRISSTISRELTALRTVLAGFTIDPTALSQITSLATVISSLNGVKISTNIAKQITEIQRVMSTFTIPPAALTSLTSLATALTTLSTAAAGLRGAAGTIRSTISAASSAAGRTFGGTGTSGLFGGLMKISMLRMAGRYLANFISLSNQYQEDLNLFTASLGKYASEAKSYAEQVSEAFGLDPAEWMRNLGVFNTLISGYGVAADRAYKMSQNLTQLGYDLSSFFNIKSSDAMSKLQSAIAGELRPMRKLGYDLSQARLEYIAKTLGIEKEISNMNQAEKAQLRYYALLNQVTVAQQDMSRTIDTPANQLRILSAMATQAGRAIGNVFIPMLNAILPVATAVVKAIRNIANAIANLFGFELTDVDYSGLEDTSGATDELGDSLDSAGGSAQKLKQALMGFDEINKLPDMNKSGGSGGGGSEGSDWEWDLSGYDFLGNAVNERLDAAYAKFKPMVDWVTEHIDWVLIAVGSIGSILAGWNISTTLLGNAGLLGTTLKGIWDLFGAVATMWISVNLQFKFQKEFYDTSALSSFAKQILVSAGGVILGGSFIGRLLSRFGVGAGNAIKYGMAVTLAVDGIATLVTNIDNSLSEGWTWENTAEDLKSAAEVGIAAYLSTSGVLSATGARGVGLGVAGVVMLTSVMPAIVQDGITEESLKAVGMAAFLIGAGGWLIAGTAGLGIGVGIAVALTIGAVGINLLSKSKLANTSDEEMWGWVHKSVEECETQAQKLFDSIELTAHISVLDAAIKNRAQAVTAVNDELGDFIEYYFAETSKTLKFGASIYVKSTAQEIYDEYTTYVKPELESKMKANEAYVDAYMKLGGIRNKGGELIDVSSSFTDFDEIMYSIGDQWGNLMQEGIRNGFTAEMQKTLDLLQWELSILNNASYSSTTAGEASVQTQALLLEMKKYDPSTALNTYTNYTALRSSTETQLTAEAEQIRTDAITEMLRLQNAYNSAMEDISKLEEGSEEWTTAMEFASKLKVSLDKASENVESFDVGETVKGWMELIFGSTDAEMQTIFDSTAGKGLVTADYNMMRAGFVKFGGTTTASLANAIRGMIDSELGTNASKMLTTIPQEYYDKLISAARGDYSESEINAALRLIGLTVSKGNTGYTDDINAYLAETGFVRDDNVKAAYADLVNQWGHRGKPDEELLRTYVESVLAAPLSDPSFVNYVTDIPDTIYSAMAKDVGFANINEMLDKLSITVNGTTASEYYTKTYEKVEELSQVASETSAAVEEMQQTDTVTAVTEEVAAVEEVVQAIANDLNTAAETATEELSASTEALDTVVTTYSESSGKISDAGTAVGNAALKIQQAAARLASVTPRVKIEVEYRHSMFNGGADVTPSITVSKNSAVRAYATGGFPKTGSMFIAGERGPELVGRIGNRTAVANDEQISDIISSQMGGNEESLASAIVGAMKAAGMGAVYLDGRQLAASINGETRRTGKSAIVI